MGSLVLNQSEVKRQFSVDNFKLKSFPPIPFDFSLGLLTIFFPLPISPTPPRAPESKDHDLFIARAKLGA